MTPGPASRRQDQGRALHAPSPSLSLRLGVRGAWKDNACAHGKEGLGAAALALPSFKLVRRGSWGLCRTGAFWLVAEIIPQKVVKEIRNMQSLCCHYRLGTLVRLFLGLNGCVIHPSTFHQHSGEMTSRSHSARFGGTARTGTCTHTRIPTEDTMFPQFKVHFCAHLHLQIRLHLTNGWPCVGMVTLTIPMESVR